MLPPEDSAKVPSTVLSENFNNVNKMTKTHSAKKILGVMIILIFAGLGATSAAEISDLRTGVLMKGKVLKDDKIKVDVEIKGVLTPVLGTAFHLNYDDNLKFLKYAKGDFLEKGGKPTYLLKNNQEFRELIFGQTLKKTDDFPLDDGKLVSFYFTVKEKAGEYRFFFDRGVVSALNNGRKNIQGIYWRNLTLKSAEVKKGLWHNFNWNFLNSRNFIYILIAGLIVIAGGSFILFYLRGDHHQKKRKSAPGPVQMP